MLVGQQLIVIILLLIIFTINLFNYVYKMSRKTRKRKLFLAQRYSVMKQLELQYVWHFA